LIPSYRQIKRFIVITVIICYANYNKMLYKTGGCSMSTYDRKITKIGNSYGITFPKELLKKAKISYGDQVSIELTEGKITMKKKEDITLPEGVDHDFMKLLSDVIQEHDTAFKGLVDK